MKCNVCGSESGNYPLCKVCNAKKENGEIIKCEKCGTWHYADFCCSNSIIATDDACFLYDAKKTLISKSEQSFYEAIKASLPEGYYAFPQINLASFIERTDNSRFHNELFRNVDFLITNIEYKPQIVIEINDQSHLNNERKERDEKVRKICEEAGIPILKLWTSYGINFKYINERINEMLNALPASRIHHFEQVSIAGESVESKSLSVKKKNKGCYIATCIYGSYDCPEVWVLRRFRDNILSNSCLGKVFIRVYYFFSPSIVKVFGKSRWFINSCKLLLDKLVSVLRDKGVENTPYND